ncbi:helicase-related protein [Actinoplanes sp. NPDC051859]|uniref:helicase-related protein n=1 Tax=Actinoplanes sp. NPDC051859 TaxID=3363909 RepID=UPI00378C9AAF
MVDAAGFEPGQRIHVPGLDLPTWVTVDLAQGGVDGGWILYVADDAGSLSKVTLGAKQASQVVRLVEDGRAPSARVLAGMWTRWMAAAATNAKTTLLASSPLRPYAHQANAVYGAMLPQPFLRFLLADEPGTGKTIMAGLYLREMQRLGLIRRALVVVPANLASKWQEDFERFFGGGLRRITADTVREHALDTGHDLWVVSLELAATNGAVQDAVRPDKAGWDIVVFDEAHRLTPTATSFHQVGRMLAKNTPRALLMTATPHRGSEWLFRHLLHLVDPDIYPDPGDKSDESLQPLRPGPVHFLRRMKEDLVDYDGVTRLFKGRTANNFRVPLGSKEYSIYRQALEMVDQFFPSTARTLARMVYGKRAASTLFALRETLRRRSAHMGAKTEAEAVLDVERLDEADEEAKEEAKVIHASSQSGRAERAAIKELLRQLDAILMDGGYEPSKWRDLTRRCLGANGIAPGSGEQAVIFTEYADSADWIVQRLVNSGYTARMYSGRQSSAERDAVRAAFMRREFQVIVTTDAGNEGIDLQAAHVLVNYDMPWSLVRLEQRMGRIHRVGQFRDVLLYNLIATDTREGDVLHTLLERFVSAASELGGQIFDSLSTVAEMTGMRYEQWLTDLYGDDEAKKAAADAAVRKVHTADLKRAARIARAQESVLASQVDAMAALTLLQRDLLDRINPAIVESYLNRLDQARLLRVQRTAAGDGILLISSDRPLPQGLGGGQQVLIATSGEALRAHGVSVDTSNVLPLGPGDAAFTDLITLADDDLAADMYRSGAADDPTSVSGYDLHAFEATLTEAGGKRRTTWAALIRVDDNGLAYPVRWETLANLVPSESAGTAPHPGRIDTAGQAAATLAAKTRDEHQRVRSEWFAHARRDLQNLPVDLTVGIADKQERVATRRRLEQRASERLAELEALSQVGLSEPKVVARLRVHPKASPRTTEEMDSETVAMLLVLRSLQEDGWRAADVHADNRGYDLHAIRGREQRLVEVKGVWRSAASNGIRMTGNEVLIATQHRTDYWLYVVDQCHDGQGVLFGMYRDPVKVFAEEIRSDAVFRVPGSTLSKYRTAPHQENPE